MNGSRFGLMPLGLRTVALCLAVLAVAGCSAPDDHERARFGLVSGFVLDEFNQPVPGAQVAVVDRAPGAEIGTRNYFGSRGPFVTNARGQFRIEGVKVALTDQVVLNLVATHPSYLASYASNVAPVTLEIGGGRLVRGVKTRDILVAEEFVSDVVVVMAQPGLTQTVGTAGGTVTVPITQTATATLAQPVNVTVTFPPGALTKSTQVSVSPLTAERIANVSAALPATLPTTIGSVAPPAISAAASETDAVTIESVVPLSSLNLALQVGGVSLGDYVFPPGLEPTVTLPLPFRMQTGALVPILRFSESGTSRARQQVSPEGAGAWLYVSDGKVVNGKEVEFKVPRPGTYAAAAAVTWQLGAAKSTAEPPRDFNPIQEFVQTGYLATSLDVHLAFTGLNDSDTPEHLAFLRTSLAAVTGAVTEGQVTVVVLPGTTFGKHVEQWERTVEATVKVGNTIADSHSGLWRFWVQRNVTLPVLPQIPVHLQGHIQGGGE